MMTEAKRFNLRNVSVAIVASLCVSACTGAAEDEDTGEEGDSKADGSGSLSSKAGTFRFMTYNVHGMPDVVTSRNPEADIPLISPKLNSYDAVVVQKDFVYHQELVSQLTLPNRTNHTGGEGSLFNLGDGLNAFSKFRLSNVVREQWGKCHGYISNKSDCLAPKGFMKVTMEIAPGVFVDVYDVHMDAGRSRGDITARNAQIAQLTAAIAKHSAGKAIIVAGDTTMRETDEISFQNLLKGSNLKDACRTLSCSQPSRQNRIMFRDSAKLKFTIKQWKADGSFVNDAGEQLSDQLPVSAVIRWQAL